MNSVLSEQLQKMFERERIESRARRAMTHGFVNGMWVGKSFARAVEETKQTMEANAAWGEYNDMAMKQAYQMAESRLEQLIRWAQLNSVPVP